MQYVALEYCWPCTQWNMYVWKLSHASCFECISMNILYWWPHRCEHLLKQQSSIIVYRLPTKENKRPFSVSVCRKQTEVCRVFRLQKTDGSCRVLLVLFSICGIPEMWRMDMETYRLADMQTCRHGDMKTWRHGQADINQKMVFLNPFTVSSLCANGSFSVCPVCWRRNRWKSIFKRSK